jgi:hypothetical protein
MPTYNFLDTITNKEIEVFLKMSELDDFKKSYPNYQQIIGSPNIVSGFSTSKNHRVPEGFKEVLSKTAEAHPTSVLADRIGGKSIKQVKTEQIVDKHWKRSLGK